ncbi:MAG TPA: hypothetical protein VHB70_12985 [Parafilimonas sp.]|nr:hypothetical protein [Parafilimonas sp.]
MEVHHHPKVEKKNFKEYFFEFIMIFVAVSMGFLAESLHEHYNNKETVQRNMESLVKNLQSDSSGLVWNIAANQEIVSWIDSLVMLPGSYKDTVYQNQFFYYVKKLTYSDFFIPDESAFEQMKSTGALKLIKQNVADSMLKYIQQNKLISEPKSAIEKWFNVATENLMHLSDIRDAFKGKQLKLSGSYEQMQEYINCKIAEMFAINLYIQHMQEQLTNVQSLIPFLKKEYNIQ